MSHKSSGLWCDLCGMPILSDTWWNIGLPIENSTEKSPGHSCDKCQKEYQRRFDLYDAIDTAGLEHTE